MSETPVKYNAPGFIYFEMPPDPAYLEALGRVSVCHAWLDRMLQMTVKTVAEISVDEAIKATAKEGSATLRRRIDKLATKRLGEGADLLRLQAILSDCERLTELRNEYLHRICVRELDGPHRLVGPHDAMPLPTAEDLRLLANQILATANSLNYERLEGWLAAAMSRAKKPSP